MRCVALLGAFVGLRRGEILGLRRGDVDLDRCEVAIVRQRQLDRHGHATHQAALRYQHATQQRARAIADALDDLIDPGRT